MIKNESKTIGELTFTVYQLPAFRGLKMSRRLTVLLGPIVGDLIKIGGAKGFENADVGEMAHTISGALEKLSDEDMESLIKELLYNTTFKRGTMELPLLPNFDEEMADKIFDTFKLLAFAVQVNFGNFINALSLKMPMTAAVKPS